VLALRLFWLLAVLAVILALITMPTKQLVLSLGISNLRGSMWDPGLQGHTGLAGILDDMGSVVVPSLDDAPEEASTAAFYIVNPGICLGSLGLLKAEVYEALERYGRVSVLVTGVDCMYEILDSLVDHSRDIAVIYGSAEAALAVIEGSAWPYNLEFIVAVVGPWRPLATLYVGQPGEGEPLGASEPGQHLAVLPIGVKKGYGVVYVDLEYVDLDGGGGDLRIVVSPDEMLLSNYYMFIASEAGIPDDFVRRVVNFTGFGGPPDVVVNPYYMYEYMNETLPPVGVSLNIRYLAATALSMLSGAEEAVAGFVRSNPLILLALTALIALPLGNSLLKRALGPGRRDAAIEPFYPLKTVKSTEAYSIVVRGGGRLDRRLIMESLGNLYVIADVVLRERYSAGVDEVVSRSDLLRAVARDSGMDEGEVYRVLSRLSLIYHRKIASRRLLPIVISWRREFSKLYQPTVRLLESLGAQLTGARGIEYKIAAGSYRVPLEESNR